MKDTKSKSDESWPCSWEEHERDQIIYRLTKSTPSDRLQWVEEMLELFGKEKVSQLKQFEKESLNN